MEKFVWGGGDKFSALSVPHVQQTKVTAGTNQRSDLLWRERGLLPQLPSPPGKYPKGLSRVGGWDKKKFQMMLAGVGVWSSFPFLSRVGSQ